MLIRNKLLATTMLCAFDNAPDAPGYYPTAAQVAQAKEAHRKRTSTTAGDPMTRRAADMNAMVDYWDLTDAIVTGLDAMVEGGSNYLPRFADEEDTAYKQRLSLTKMTNIYRDVVEGLAARPFEQEVTFIVEQDKTVPQELLDFAEDVDGSGNNLTMYAGATFFNGINSSIDWIFVDNPKVDNATIRTVADKKRAGLRPYWSHVLGRNVLEARVQINSGKETLTYVRIFEPGSPDQVRIFEREPNGAIMWSLYERREAQRDYGPDEKTSFWEIDGGRLGIDTIPLVPFYTGRREGRTFRFYPAMRDAADLQKDLYQDESALKFVKTLAGYPMLAANGIRPQQNEDGTVKKIATGPMRVLYSAPDASGHAGVWSFLEPSGSSMKFLADNIKESQQQLRELGRQPLTAQSGNLTVITAATAAGKAKSAVGQWALNLKNALENATVLTMKYMGISTDVYDPVVHVFTDFDEFMEGKDLEDLNAMRTNGDLSQLTLWEEKSRRGVLSPEFDPDEEKKRLLAEVPSDGPDNSTRDDPPPVDDTPPE
jgi:hypothetical protein